MSTDFVSLCSVSEFSQTNFKKEKCKGKTICHLQLTLYNLLLFQKGQVTALMQQRSVFTATIPMTKKEIRRGKAAEAEILCYLQANFLNFQ